MKLCENIAKGCTLRDACALIGVGEDAVYRWLFRGKQDGPENAKFRTFRGAIRRARNAYKARVTLALDRAIQGGDVVGEATEVERNSRGAVTAERRDRRVTAPNGPLALKVLQMRDPKHFRPDPAATNVNVTLIQQIKQMESREGQLPDPRLVIDQAEEQLALEPGDDGDARDDGKD